ncbi:putative HD superfamily hydrolase [Streptococcus pneumoniae]|nr:putative HD superfamily hydrolase [Streptococcus pneumoniae]
MAQTEENLTREIASRIREAEQEVKERSDKMAKDILVQAMQRIAGEYVAESTNSTVHLPDDTMKGRIIGRDYGNVAQRWSYTSSSYRRVG